MLLFKKRQDRKMSINIWSSGMGEWSYPIIPKLLSHAFPNHSIITDYTRSPHLVVESHFLRSQKCPDYNCPYITWSGEAYDVPIYKEYQPIFNINTCYSSRPDSFYLPYMTYGILHKQITTDIREYKPSIDRKFWLSYINSNPVSIRNNLFYEFYKLNPEKCHGLGSCMNTTGRKLSGQWTTVHNTMKDYLFSISMENQIKPGYITEKIIKAFQAGCIPIYWGDKIVNEFFNPNSFIDVTKFNSLSAVTDFVVNIIQDPHKLQKYQNEHVFLNNTVPDYFLWDSDTPRHWMKPMINILQSELNII